MFSVNTGCFLKHSQGPCFSEADLMGLPHGAWGLSADSSPLQLCVNTRARPCFPDLSRGGLHASSIVTSLGQAPNGQPMSTIIHQPRGWVWIWVNGGWRKWTGTTPFPHCPPPVCHTHTPTSPSRGQEPALLSPRPSPPTGLHTLPAWWAEEVSFASSH